MIYPYVTLKIPPPLEQTWADAVLIEGQQIFFLRAKKDRTWERKKPKGVKGKEEITE
jgi:hypothetical protein